ncbi:replicase polyprotein 1a [Striga asiatica]|uniref:Replicase polyprotein 1a n=1 Tax=Striga asiatica TaxID=4170 RepID=A0A5A7PJF7_STRAF|nr:replicase polyprotein 1a [Striga asiatica]
METRIKIRSKSYWDSPNPSYDRSSDLFTVILWCGGKFQKSDFGVYEGGHKMVFDFVPANEMSEKKLKLFSTKFGVVGDRSYFIQVGLSLRRLEGDDDVRIWAKSHLSEREFNVFVEVFNTFEPSSLSVEGSWVDLDESDSDNESGSKSGSESGGDSGSESGSESESEDNVVGVEGVTQEDNIVGVGSGIRSQNDVSETNLDVEDNLVGVNRGKGVHLSDAENSEGNEDSGHSTDWYDEFFDSDYDMRDASSDDDDALFFEHVDTGANGEDESESSDSDNEDVIVPSFVKDYISTYSLHHHI